MRRGDGDAARRAEAAAGGVAGGGFREFVGLRTPTNSHNRARIVAGLADIGRHLGRGGGFTPVQSGAGGGPRPRPGGRRGPDRSGPRSRADATLAGQPALDGAGRDSTPALDGVTGQPLVCDGGFQLGADRGARAGRGLMVRISWVDWVRWLARAKPIIQLYRWRPTDRDRYDRSEG